MNYLQTLQSGFEDELEKIAGGWLRSGSVPIRVHNLIKRHNKGNLKLKGVKKFKGATIVKEADVQVVGRQHHELTLDIPMKYKGAQFYAPAVPFSVGEPSIPRPPFIVKRKKGDAPSKEDMDALPRREDGRESATVVHGLGQQSSNIGTSLTPTGEHS